MRIKNKWNTVAALAIKQVSINPAWGCEWQQLYSAGKSNKRCITFINCTGTSCSLNMSEGVEVLLFVRLLKVASSQSAWKIQLLDTTLSDFTTTTDCLLPSMTCCWVNNFLSAKIFFLSNLSQDSCKSTFPTLLSSWYLMVFLSTSIRHDQF